jgi:hypothetical protein
LKTNNPISLEARIYAAANVIDQFFIKWIGEGYIDSIGSQIVDDFVIALTTIPDLSVTALQQRADAIVVPILALIPQPILRDLAEAIVPRVINQWIASGDALLIAKAQAQSQGLTVASGN